jgi:hypothetical protein
VGRVSEVDQEIDAAVREVSLQTMGVPVPPDRPEVVDDIWQEPGLGTQVLHGFLFRVQAGFL